MPGKKKTVKAKAKASAKANNKTSVVVNVNAPARRRASSKRAAPVAAAPRQSIYFHAAERHISPMPHELGQLAMLQGIQRDLAAVKANQAVVTAANPIFDTTPNMTPPPSITATEQAESAFTRGLPSPGGVGQRLPRRETMFDPAGAPLLAAVNAANVPEPSAKPRARPKRGDPGTVINPVTGYAMYEDSTRSVAKARKASKQDAAKGAN